MVTYVVAALIGYLLGSFPSGFLVGKARGIDVRKFGSGATGGTNVLRTVGVWAAVLTGLLDVGKGLLGAYIGYRLCGHAGYALGGFFAMVGHSYPVWLGFRGGKSVATGGGAMVLLHPWAFVLGLAAGVGVIFPTKWVSLGSLVGTLVICGVIWLSGAPAADKWMALGAFLVIYIRHWGNMKRLVAGTERKIGQKANQHSET